MMMVQCLRKRALLLAAAGEGTTEQLAHIRDCEQCRTAYLRYSADLGRIDQVFRTTVPPFATVTKVARPTWWLSFAVATSALVFLLWSAWPIKLTLQSVVSLPSSQLGEEVEFADETDELLTWFPTDETYAFIVQSPIGADPFSQALVDDPWACEWQEDASATDCDVYPFPFPFEG